jgi:SAM-dependent methyltransferase
VAGRAFLTAEARKILGEDPSIDVCVIVPKDDEFRAHLEVFGVDGSVDELPDLCPDRYPFVVTTLGELRVLLLCMQHQSNTHAANATREVLDVVRPVHIYLSGTALGNPRRAPLGSVRVSDHIDHVEQWVEDGASKRPRWAHYQPPKHVRRDLGSFIEKHRQDGVLRQVVAAHLMTAEPETWESLLRMSHLTAEMGYMVTDNALVRDDGARFWDLDERLASYDMECGGFASVLDNEPSVAWAVVRGISDHGTDKANADDGMRHVASLAAASFLRSFIQEGLLRSHPRALKPAFVKTTRLSPEQHYVAYSATDYFVKRIRDEFDFELPLDRLHRSVQLEDIAVHLVLNGMDRDDAMRFLTVLRVEYFEEKYADYSYDVDLRGYFEGYWQTEFKEFLAAYGYDDLAGRNVIDVGCGNGIELQEIFGETIEPSSITCVDVSPRMVAEASTRVPNSHFVSASADDLRGVSSESQDVYFSLRTYMSRFFDVPAALREAYRVLAPGGLLVISIANGYLDRDSEDRPVIIPGLKDAHGTTTVDPARPFQLVRDYHSLITRLGFQQPYIMAKLTDVYLGAIKPFGPAGIERDPLRIV